MNELTREACVNSFRDAYRETDDQEVVNKIAARALIKDHLGDKLYDKILSWHIRSSNDDAITVALLELMILYEIEVNLIGDNEQEQATQLGLLVEERMRLLGDEALTPVAVVIAVGQIMQVADASTRQEHKDRFFRKLDRLATELGTTEAEALAEACLVPTEVIEHVQQKRAQDPEYCPRYQLLIKVNAALVVIFGQRRPKTR